MRASLFRAVLLAGGLLSSSAFGQLFSVGVKAGIPLNDAFVAGSGPAFNSETTTDRYIIGPQAEIRLPFHLGVEADALYRHYSVDGLGVSEWDFPILLKYRFKGFPLLHPFADAGPIFNHVSDLGSFTANQSTAGLAIGGGLDVHVLFLHLTPEFRYIHWSDQNYLSGNPRFHSNQNQAQFLVGFSF